MSAYVSSFRLAVLGALCALGAATLLLLPSSADAQSSAASPSASSASQQLGKRALRSGSKGADVKELQQLLRKAGFKTAVDGVFGPGTVRAVQRFQRAARLETSGVVGRKTVQALRKATSGTAFQSLGGFDSEDGAGRQRSLGDRIPLRKGMHGHDVKVLQDYLRRAGIRTKVDGEFGAGTVKNVKKFEQLQEREDDGVMDAGDIDALRGAVDGDRGLAPAEPVAPAKLAPGDRATVGPDGLAIAPANAPEAVKQIIAAGNAIATKPYRYGGGHGKWQDTGYDCSGSVSYALHGADLLKAPMPSGSFESWGDAGPGQWVTIYANGGHMYMVVAGLRFDTSGRQKTGSRWQTASRSSAGFTVRHPPGL
ncbi:peptidoglycan-binding protein [Conexibacter sp. SYSU D00693]|uniref:peptidoglycan-binding domain-containing protein n=1 Tax=Conexibacter sp. SYSU D00693 TaxID=2812560 RepID=UPI00196A516F|nr:peptidoglycan-binding protein [Conexibacter sp. SYSU D00693]